MATVALTAPIPRRSKRGLRPATIPANYFRLFVCANYFGRADGNARADRQNNFRALAASRTSTLPGSKARHVCMRRQFFPTTRLDGENFWFWLL